MALICWNLCGQFRKKTLLSSWGFRVQGLFSNLLRSPCKINNPINVSWRGCVRKVHKTLTRILPVVVCPEISSPAQSLASVMNVPSNSCLPCLAAFCSFCLGSFGPNSASFRQQRKAKSLHTSTMSSPATKVQTLDKRKHHHLRTRRQVLSTMTVPLFRIKLGGSFAANSLVMPR